MKATPDEIERVKLLADRFSGAIRDARRKNEFVVTINPDTASQVAVVLDIAIAAMDLERLREPLVLDLRISAFDQMSEAAGKSNWIPPEYMANDWIADCCHFLRTGEGNATDAEIASLREQVAAMRKCASCGNPLSRDCPSCKRAWES